ncbi:MAG TPA: alkaline phosphatase family protein [Vicinamibacterales bacterium]|nr:alkaline phosphatase family protein [Vicinamibacterales bacterium]
MRRILTGLAAATAATVLLSAQAAPKLVVMVVVDQMRADYIQRFGQNWTSGLRRLVDDGAWFTQAAYPYLTTVTCAGHATISTGAYPHTHGIFANTWYDRERASVIPCTDDQLSRVVPYGREANSRTGPRELLVPSLADQMRGQGGHVVTLALKARSAIMLAGHGGDAVTWISESLDGWESSTAYTQTPIPQVKAFIAANPMDADYGKSWTRLLGPSDYKDSDEGTSEDPTKGWSASFPHLLKGEGSRPDTSFFDQWQHSPFADAYVARMASALAESMQLGKHAGTDFLGVSFSSPDLVGHSFGPRSQEVQDMYAHLDQSIGGLLNKLDQTVGAGQYVLALSSDHGVADIPEQARKAGRDAGRISASGVLNAGEERAEAQMGRNTYLARLNGNDVYFAPGMYERVARRPGVLKDIMQAMQRQPGVSKVYTSEEVAKGATSSDPQLRAAALSYVPKRSGDLIVSPKPGWMFAGAGTTHGSASPDDQRVPVILYGFGVKAGHYDGAASPADIAPTLAALAGVVLPNAEGHPLKEALR